MTSEHKDQHDMLTSRSPWTWSVIIWTVSLVLSVGILIAIWLLAKPLALFFLGITIAAAFSPLVDKLEERLPRIAAILLIYGILVAVVGLAGVVAIPIIIEQSVILIEQLPDLLDEFAVWFDQNELLVHNLGEGFTENMGEVGRTIITIPLVLLSASIDIFVIFVLSMYLLLDTHRIRVFFSTIFPKNQRKHVLEVSREMLAASGGYVRGVTIDITIVALIMSIGLTIIGVNFAVVFGIFAAFMELFPILGPFIASIPILLVSFLQSPTTGIIALAFILAVQFFEGNILVPNIMHREAHVPPYIVILALLSGATIGGVLGAVTAIPLAAAMRVFILRVIVPEIKRQAHLSYNRD